MKLLITLLLIPTLSFALPQSKRINAATTTIPSAFSTAAGSLLISEATSPSRILIDNRTSTEIEVNCAHAASGAATEVPSSSEGTSLWVNASTALIIDDPSIKGDCYVRSVGAPITSGILTVTVIGQ